MAAVEKFIYSSVNWLSESCSWMGSLLVQRTYALATPVFKLFFDVGSFIGFWSERKIEPVGRAPLPDTPRAGNSGGEGESSGSSRLDPSQRKDDKGKEEDPLRKPEDEVDPQMVALQWEMTEEELEAQKRALDGFSKTKPVIREKESPRVVIAKQNQELAEASLNDAMNRSWSESGTILLKTLSRQIEQLERKKEDLKKLEFCLSHRAFKRLDTPQEDPLSQKERVMLRERIESTIEKVSDKSLLDLSVKELHDKEIEEEFQTVTACYQKLSESNQERESLHTQLTQTYAAYHAKLRSLTLFWEIRGDFLKKKRELAEMI